MEASAAQEWLNLLMEISVGVFVFLISVPAMIYSTFMPEKIRAAQMSAGSKTIINHFVKSYWLTLSIVILTMLHLWATQTRHGWSDSFDPYLNWLDGCFECTDTTGHHTCALSYLFIWVESFLFVWLVFSVYKSSRRMVGGGIVRTTERLRRSLIRHYKDIDELQEKFQKNPFVKPVYSMLSYFKRFSWKGKKIQEKQLWDQLEIIGRNITAGSAKQDWIKHMGDLINYLTDQPNHTESLKSAVKLLGDVMSEETNLATYENIKDTLDIYRNLLNGKLRYSPENEQLNQFSEGYSAISRSLEEFAISTLKSDNHSLASSIISTITLLPVYSDQLLKIALLAIKNENYEILAYAFSEIVGAKDDEPSKAHNFWAIYAALTLKDGPYQQYAENMRKSAGYPAVSTKLLRDSYNYHFSIAQFDVADLLYRLIAERSKRDPGEA